jgi:hypothetical protein
VLKQREAIKVSVNESKEPLDVLYRLQEHSDDCAMNKTQFHGSQTPREPSQHFEREREFDKIHHPPQCFDVKCDTDAGLRDSALPKLNFGVSFD